MPVVGGWRKDDTPTGAAAFTETALATIVHFSIYTLIKRFSCISRAHGDPALAVMISAYDDSFMCLAIRLSGVCAHQFYIRLSFRH